MDETANLTGRTIPLNQGGLLLRDCLDFKPCLHAVARVVSFTCFCGDVSWDLSEHCHFVIGSHLLDKTSSNKNPFDSKRIHHRYSGPLALAESGLDGVAAFDVVHAPELVMRVLTKW